MAAIAIVNVGQIVTLAGPPRPRVGPELRDLSILEHGTIIVEDGLIRTVGHREDVLPMITGDIEVFDAGGRVLLPGFVDAHTHPVFAGTRVDEYELRSQGATYQEIAAAGGGIRSTVRSTRTASMEELVQAGRKYAQWFLRCGTTTVEAKSGYGLSLEDEVKILRAIRRLNEETHLSYVPTFLGAHDIPDEYRERRDAYVDLIVNVMLPQVKQENLAEFCDVFCEERVFTPGESRRILEAAGRLGLGIRMHADQLSLSGGAKLAAELHARTADHLENTDAEGIAALARAGVQPVLLPCSVYALGLSRYPQAREMIESGLGVVLATDFNPGSSPTPSMQMVLSLASTHLKMTPAESITAATINAAYSLNRGHMVGSIEPGKQADLCLYDCSDYRELPYFFGLEHTHTVWKAGQKVFEKGPEVSTI
jgi:imidazolonepropionase